MTSTKLDALAEHNRAVTPREENFVRRILNGQLGAGIVNQGNDGTRRDNALTTNYAHQIHSQAVGGLGLAILLRATPYTDDVPAVPTLANSSSLFNDLGIQIGAKRALRLYDTPGTDYASLSGDEDGGLVLGGSGANAGGLNITSLLLTQQASAPAAPAAGLTTLYALTSGRIGYRPTGGAATPIANYAETVTSILTTQGDLVYASGANTPVRLAKGTAFQELTMNSGATAPQWSNGPLALAAAAGDTFYATGANALAKLSKGTAFQALYMNSGATAPEWAASPRSLLTARGDLLTASAANTPARLAVGATKTVLASDGTDPGWTASPTLSGTLTVEGDVLVGSTPASFGAIRLPKNVAIWARNDTNSGDISVIGTASTDVVQVGNTGFRLNLLGTVFAPSIDPPTIDGQVTNKSQAKGWVEFSVSGGVLTVNQSYNATASRVIAGEYTITWDRDFAAATYAVVATPLHATTVLIPKFTGKAAGSCTLGTYDLTGTLSEATSVSVIAYGTLS